MELGTFGAIMKFAMELETSAQHFYETVLALDLDSNIESLVKKFHKRCSTRVKLLERVRRENVTEMILEPIEDFESNPYVIATSISEGTDPVKICDMASVAEETRQGFFEKASVKIEFLIEAAETFERLSEENQENLEHLSTLL